MVTAIHCQQKHTSICEEERYCLQTNITNKSMQVTYKRKSFLRNTHNKTELIRILWQRFTEIGIKNEQSVGDAIFLR